MASPKKKKGLLNPELQLAVDDLYEKGKVTQSKEIAEKLGFSPGQVSSYINGKAEMSDSFKTAFETKFGISLVEYERAPNLIVNARPDKIDYQAKYVACLEDDKAWLKKMLETSLAEILKQTQLIGVRQKGTGEVVLHSLERIEEKKKDQLVEEADMRILQIDKEAHTNDSAGAPHR